MALPPDLEHLDRLLDLMSEAALEEAVEIQNEDGDIPPEYSAEADPPQEDDDDTD